MSCGYATLWTTGVRIWNQVSRRACSVVSTAFEISLRPAHRSQQLQHLTILVVKFRSISNAPPSLQVVSGARENALAESESTLQSSRGCWEHLEVLRSTWRKPPEYLGGLRKASGPNNTLLMGVSAWGASWGISCMWKVLPPSLQCRTGDLVCWPTLCSLLGRLQVIWPPGSPPSRLPPIRGRLRWRGLLLALSLPPTLSVERCVSQRESAIRVSLAVHLLPLGDCVIVTGVLRQSCWC